MSCSLNAVYTCTTSPLQYWPGRIKGTLILSCNTHINFSWFNLLTSDEGRLFQVTAGIKVSSGRKSADGEEVDTIMTPL